MKRTLLTILSVLFCAITFAQSVPQGINYQAVARDASGDVLMNQALTIRFSVIADIADTTNTGISWQETHPVTTNDYGLFTSIIGNNTTTGLGFSATFDVIDWGASNHLLKVEVDYGGGIFVDMGTTAFMSVPYALSSATSTDNQWEDGIDASSIPGGGSYWAKPGGTWPGPPPIDQRGLRIQAQAITFDMIQGGGPTRGVCFNLADYNGDSEFIIQGSNFTRDFVLAPGGQPGFGGCIADFNGTLAVHGTPGNSGVYGAYNLYVDGPSNLNGNVVIGGDLTIGTTSFDSLESVISTHSASVFEFNTDSSSFIYGCTDPAGGNYDPGATADDGSCWVSTGTTSIPSGTGAGIQAPSNTASGYYSTAMGQSTLASAANSTAMGRYNVGGGHSFFSYGAQQWVATDPLFEVGNGSDNSNRNNALTVYKNGRAEFDSSVTATHFIGDVTGSVDISSDNLTTSAEQKNTIVSGGVQIGSMDPIINGILPNFIGQIFVNTTNGKVYVSKGTTSGDWLVLN